MMKDKRRRRRRGRSVQELIGIKSFTDYGIMVPPGRRFRLVLDTDEVRFGGQGRIKPRQVFTPEPVVKDNERVDYVRLYLPARTALVLARQRRGKVCPCTP